MKHLTSVIKTLRMIYKKKENKKKCLHTHYISTLSYIKNTFSEYVVGAKSRVSHQLPFVRMTILVSQRGLVWCIVYAEEDG